MGARVLPAPSEGSVVRPERLRRLFEDLLEDQQEGNLTRAASLGYLQLMLAEILHPPPVTVAQGTSVQVARRTAGFIADHLTEPDLSTAVMATALGFNADYLGVRFVPPSTRRLPTTSIACESTGPGCSFDQPAGPFSGWPQTSASTTIDTSAGSSNGPSVSRPRQFQRLRPSG